MDVKSSPCVNTVLFLFKYTLEIFLQCFNKKINLGIASWLRKRPETAIFVCEQDEIVTLTFEDIPWGPAEFMLSILYPIAMIDCYMSANCRTGEKTLKLWKCNFCSCRHVIHNVIIKFVVSNLIKMSSPGTCSSLLSSWSPLSSLKNSLVGQTCPFVGW